MREAGWRLDERIPSEVKLAKTEGVSRMTLRGALKRLEQEGFLVRAEGKSRKVAVPHPVVRHSDRQPIEKELGRLANTIGRRGDFTIEQLCSRCPALLEQLHAAGKASTSWGDALRRLGQEPVDTVVRPIDPIPCYNIASDPHFDLAELMQSINVKADCLVYWLLRVRQAGETPIALQWCVVPVHPLGDDTELSISKRDLVPGGLTKAYKASGIQRDFASVSFRAHRATADEAHLLKIDIDAPLIEERRVSYALRSEGSTRRLWPYEYLLTLYTDKMRLHSAWTEMNSGSLSSRTTRKFNEHPSRHRTR
jgi:DNA-binding GntR family transcriptional regulator